MSIYSMNFYFAVILLILRKQIVTASVCPHKCDCPDQPTSCPNGATLVSDGCDCCMVCARQIDEPCNEIYICDFTKGLSCRYYYETKKTGYGVCTASRRQSCSHEGHVIAHGHTLTQGCKEQCSCNDGILTCRPICPDPIPMPTGCENPIFRMPHPGECCAQWVCESEYDPDYYGNYGDYGEMTNSIEDQATIFEEDPGSDGDEMDYQFEHFFSSQSPNKAHNGYGNGIYDKSLITNFLPLDVHEYKDTKKDCKRLNSGWTPCSKTCGMGIQYKTSNENPQCTLKKERRLCNIRPCHQPPKTTNQEKRTCNRYIEKSTKRKTLVYKNKCFAKVQTKFCGLCNKNTKKCCKPNKTKTQTVEFKCINGSVIRKQFMTIKSCSCSRNCKSNRYRKRQRGPKLSARENFYNVR